MPRCRPLPITLATALIVLAPCSAQAEWRSENLPSTDGAQPPRTLAVDQQGRGLIVFEGFSETRSPQRFTGSGVRAAGGGWMRTGDLAGIGWGSAQAQLYARTRALLVARQVIRYGAFNRARFRLVWALGRSDGSFGAWRQIPGTAAGASTVVDPAGDAVVAFARQGGSIVRVSERSARGRFGAPRDLSPKGASRPTVAMNARGDRVVAWFRGDRVEARIRRAGGSWGSVLKTARVMRSADQSVHAVVAPSGRIALAWQSVDVRESRPVQLEAGVSVRPRGAGWHGAIIERSILDSQSFAAQAAAMPVIDTVGRLLVVYTGRWRSGTGVRLARVTNSARITTNDLLSAEAANATLDDAATGPAASVAATWAEHDGVGGVHTVATLRRGIAPFEPAAVLTPDGTAGLVGSRVVFSRLTGEALAVVPVVAAGASRLTAAVSDPITG